MHIIHTYSQAQHCLHLTATSKIEIELEHLKISQTKKNSGEIEITLEEQIIKKNKVKLKLMITRHLTIYN